LGARKTIDLGKKKDSENKGTQNIVPAEGLRTLDKPSGSGPNRSHKEVKDKGKACEGAGLGKKTPPCSLDALSSEKKRREGFRRNEEKLEERSNSKPGKKLKRAKDNQRKGVRGRAED